MRLLCHGAGIRNAALVWIALFAADWAVTRYFFGTVTWTSNPRFVELPLTDAGVVLFVAYQLLILLCASAHFAAAVTDPGIVRNWEVQLYVAPDPTACRVCGGRGQPPRAYHCLLCDACVFRMDHHCTWINNCIGLANQKVFLLFLFYISTASAITFILLVCCLLQHRLGLGLAAVIDTQPNALVCGLLSAGALCCAVVVLVVSEFFLEQLEGIRTNSTVVESYMGLRGENMTFNSQFRVVFGDAWWTWPCPVRARVHMDYAEPAFRNGRRRIHLKASDYEYLGIAGGREEEDEHFPCRTRAGALVGSMRGRQVVSESTSDSIRRLKPRAATPTPSFGGRSERGCEAGSELIGVR